MPGRYPNLTSALIALLFLGGIFFLITQYNGLQDSREETAALYFLYPIFPSPTPPVSATSTSDTADVRILTYHIVRPSYPSDTASIKQYAVTPEVFDAELSHLDSAGYHVISFADLENHFHEGTALPSKPVIITVDDGWKDQVEYALPILEKYHDTATFFVFTNAIGGKGFLSWDDLKQMLAAGMTIGSHTKSHPFLTHIKNPTALKNQIEGSKAVLEKNLGVPINEFAYPFGQYDAAAIEAVKQAGYKSARGDFYFGPTQSAARIFELSALNAPTSLSQFVRYFP